MVSNRTNRFSYGEKQNRKIDTLPKLKTKKPKENQKAHDTHDFPNRLPLVHAYTPTKGLPWPLRWPHTHTHPHRYTHGDADGGTAELGPSTRD